MPLPTQHMPKSAPSAIGGRTDRRRGDRSAKPPENAIPDGGAVLKAFFDHASMGLALIDLKGCFTQVNPALCKMLGYSAKDLMGRRLQRIMAPNQWRCLSATVANFLCGRQHHAQFTLDCLHQQGKHIRCQLELSLVQDRNGVPGCFLVQIHDLSPLARAERKLVEHRRRYQALLDATAEAVVIFQEGICIDANQTASSMFKVPRDELIGRLGMDLIAPDSHDKVKKGLLSGGGAPCHAVAVKSDGTRFHVVIQGRAIQIGVNEVQMATIQDINDKVRGEAALRESERHLQSLMQSASNFVLFRLRHNPQRPSHPQPIFISPSIGDIVDRSMAFDYQAWPNLVHPDDLEGLVAAARKMLDTHRLDQTVRILGSAGKGWRWLHISAVADSDDVDSSLFFNGIILDITSQMETTAALKARESELKERTESLSEVNTALEVLLRKREADRMEVEEKMLSNAKSLILPYLDKLKASRLDHRQRIYLNLVESNLNELISPLSQRMSHHYLNFTPLEIQVANLVKEGKTTKDIAHILGLSVRTIEAVRYTIRRKLGLKKKRSNLRSYLLSIDGPDAIASRNGWPE